jgi:glutathione S-transferase
MSTQQVVYHYLDLGRLGRGEVVNLLLKDAGINVKEVRYPYDDTWKQTSEKLQQQGITRTGKLPALEYKGSIITQHIPILRYLARELDAYDAETSYDKYIVDAVADIYIDWRSKWVANLDGATPEYKNDFVPKYYRLVGKYYSDREGPYLLGDRITYTDFAIYQSIDNDRRTGTLPPTLPDSLVALENAIEARPNIAEYIKASKP